MLSFQISIEQERIRNTFQFFLGIFRISAIGGLPVFFSRSRTDLRGFPALEHSQSGVRLPTGQHVALFLEEKGRFVEHLVGLPRQLGFVSTESVAFATAQSARASRFVSFNTRPTRAVQVSARWWLDDWTIMRDGRHDFQAAGFIVRKNVSSTALAAEIARSIQTHLAASAVVDVAFVHIQTLSFIPTRNYRTNMFQTLILGQELNQINK